MSEHLTNMHRADVPGFMDDTSIPGDDIEITAPQATGFQTEDLTEMDIVGIHKIDPETGKSEHLTNMHRADVPGFMDDTSIPHDQLKLVSPQATGFTSGSLAKKGLVGIARKH